MKNYAILIYQDEAESDSLSSEAREDRFAAYRAYLQALVDAGSYIASAPLERAPTATTLRIRDGQRSVQDGPYADTKEQLGGFFMVKAADIDAALEWAARCPGAHHGILEVREVPYLPQV